MNTTIISTNDLTNGDYSIGKIVGKANTCSDLHKSKTFDSSGCGCSVVSWNESDSEGQSCNEDQVTAVNDDDKLVSTVVNNDTELVPVSIPVEWINESTTRNTTTTFFDSPLILAAAEMSRPVTCKQKRRRKLIEGDDADKEKRSKTSGRWTKKEHDIFLHGLKLYGHNWKKVAKLLLTRSSTQVRSHAQKYFTKNNEVLQSNITVEQQEQQQDDEKQQLTTNHVLKQESEQQQQQQQQHPKASLLPSTSSSSDTNNNVNSFQSQQQEEEEEENNCTQLSLLENPITLHSNKINDDILLPVQQQQQQQQQQQTLNQGQEHLLQEQSLSLSTTTTTSTVSVVEVIDDECVTTTAAAMSITENDDVNSNKKHHVNFLGLPDSFDDYNNTIVVDVVSALLGLRQQL